MSNKTITTNVKERLYYVKPQIDVSNVGLDLEILKGSDVPGGGDPTINNPEMGWGDAKDRGDSWGDMW
ncbi:MAG: hypothetical protein IJZ68_10915 [Bacteroidaceae bacterium]|nr:hypothetical protein [Bacteroidaceae bacterium]